MKKLLAIALAVILLLSFAACGSINKTEVSVLWSGDGVVRVPDSLINAMERAMYIENIQYAHYGADGDQAKQIAQAQQALDQGCAGLVVELVDVSAAQTIVDMAKANDIPLVFINSDVETGVVSSYNKCVAVVSDQNSVAKLLGEKIAESLSKEKDYKKADLNEDGKITYLALGDVSAIAEKVNEKLKEAGRNPIEAVNATSIEELTATTVQVKKTEYGRLTDKSGNVVEMIISDNDVHMQKDLVALQEKGFNADKLKTHFVPVYTVGADADYKAYLFSKIPAIDTALNDSALDKGEKIPEDVINEIRGHSNLVKFATIEKWSDLEKAIYTTRNVIGDGRITCAACEDLDGLAVAAAQAMAKMLKNNAREKDQVVVACALIG